ncbi:MAG: DUF488 domain-containing protein [Verrucomicrobia bacterium]|nr:DUF488 domain-containing protein [Verrucomicrobiota bacterium]
MEIYTIGFTKKGAAEFFDALKRAGVRRLVDVRLHNTSHLAGFAKRDDLEYFLGAICSAEYVHVPLLAPTDELLDGYKNKTLSWEEYETRFRALLSERRVEQVVDRRLFDDGPAVLLCSEPEASHCHRRLAAEYLQEQWGGFGITHL